MKKLSALALLASIAVSALLVGCGDSAPTVRFGSGVYIGTPTAVDAADDKDGSGSIDITVAAVTLDSDGKIVSCALDTASNTVKFTSDGKAVANTEFKTKQELGADYGMVAHGGAGKEWFEQADTFEALVTGKTVDEVKALAADSGKGTDEVINAGCTVNVSEFIGAIEKACASASFEVSADTVTDVSVATAQTLSDATEDRDGQNSLSVNVFASAVDGNGIILAASSDCVEVSFTFDADGVSTLDTSKAIASKRELGDTYGMKAHGGAAKEWYEQANVFDAACIGKSASELVSLRSDNGKGAEELQSAGCTVDVTGFVKAAAKK